MKNYLTISIWLIIFAVAFGLACQPEVDIKTEAASAITEPSAEITTEAPAVTEPPVETTTEAPAVTETPAETATETPAVTESPVETTTEAPVIAEPPVETAMDAIAVTVNGVDITEADIEAKIKPQLERMAKQLPPQVIGQYKKQLRQKALEGMIVEKLLDEKVKAANIVVTEEEVVEHIKQIASQQGLSLDDFKALIEAYGKNFDEWKQQMQFRRGLSYNKFFETQWAGKINITEDDAKKYYSENTKQFEMPEQVRASHILISPDTIDPNADPNEAKAKAKAQNLLKQIRDGADFATLAKANSSCPSNASGGDLGLFRRGQMVPPFEEAAFELEVGQVSDIVETQFGYHIIKATDHKDAGVVQFEQAKNDILNMLTQKRQAELAKEYIELLKAEADIIYPVESKPPDSE